MLHILLAVSSLRISRDVALLDKFTPCPIEHQETYAKHTNNPAEDGTPSQCSIIHSGSFRITGVIANEESVARLRKTTPPSRNKCRFNPAAGLRLKPDDVHFFATFWIDWRIVRSDTDS